MTSTSVSKSLLAVGPEVVRSTWKNIATEFCSDEEGLRRATIEPLLIQFRKDLDPLFDGKDCVRK